MMPRQNMRAPASWLIVAIAASLTIARVPAAQAPDINSNGDPSVASDTIYRLAVDSSAYPEQATILLLDDGVVKVEKDGRSRRTFRQVIQILRDRAAKQLEERQFNYEPDRQKLTINWVKVLKLNGDVISSKPAHSQESDLPASLVNPVYVHERSLRMSLSGLAPGTILDLSWTVEDWRPYRPGDFHERWSVSANTTVKRSRFLVDAPHDLDLRIKERHLDFARRDTIVDKRHVYTWATHDVTWVKPENFAPPSDSDALSKSVEIVSPGSWSDIGHWYASLAEKRMQPDDHLRERVKAVVAKAPTLEDSIQAIHRWVAQDIRYVALELGIGGYQPRWPDSVVGTGFGDCKDKASLFITALKTIGVEAYPVLLNAGVGPDPALPTIGAFNHEIAAIKRPSGYQYVDLTSEFSPFGTVPYPDKGTFALVVHPDGATEEVTTPPDPIDANSTEIRVTGDLTPDGLFNGHFEIRATGVVELGLRSVMRNRMDTAQRTAYIRSLAASVFPSAKGDSLETFDGRDLKATPRISLAVHDGQATQHSGNTDILTMHDASAKFAQIADALEASAPRHQAIDASRVMGQLADVGYFKIRLPEGWHARLPTSVSTKSVFGSYESTYRQDGRDLIIVKRVAGARGIYPKEKVADLVAWLREIAKDRVPFIVIEHAG